MQIVEDKALVVSKAGFEKPSSDTTNALGSTRCVLSFDTTSAKLG